MLWLGWKGNEKQEEVHKKKNQWTWVSTYYNGKDRRRINNIEILSPEMIGTLRLIKQKGKPRGQAGLRTKPISLVLKA